MLTPTSVNLPAPTTERAVTRAFEDAGAVSPASARKLAELPGVDASEIISLVAQRVIREAEPGRYYLHAGTEHARRQKWVLAVLVLLLLVLPAILVNLRVR